ncbi:phosphoribosylformylglycinamidine synthase subunit PurQ [Dissulfurirhabdus thermomarina]|uniref:Phosphoribosylformylglycinamidine synthase subunit PurQ n=1 Tax=Dissulfurirhabdus thermomarina TaxID=1765737 RepID=A0A6N9TUJ0_DISTH|nr:phosphoribosylformylglycinamidine synthase subunit PurQ [Dissulfurirhabdus thermomarina]NDY42176.1 phosphoribosylformylglycinamidine synthase subunit PurQ [Dissulfurirhabdus thermomarina]NMX22516.1 phosphoribosylformylglycinamidine synthase subunit PurQ [Dissulfurirhabdus thermomarina]
MAKQVRAIVLTGYGTNCEREMAHACRAAGADRVDVVHLSDLLDGSVRLDDYHFLNLPGGFLDGDNLGAAQAGAHRLRYARVAGSGERLMDQVLRFVKQGGLVLGVCNGFQLMVKTGLLPGFGGRYEERRVSLTYNDSGRFEDRWVTCRVEPASACVFTRGLDLLELPVRHGEGKFVAADDETLRRLEAEGLVVLRYADPGTGVPTMDYPANPNGSLRSVAGICDPTGRLFGLMPHPEAFHHRTNHPRWTREDLPEEGAGLAIFRNAVQYVRDNC